MTYEIKYRNEEEMKDSGIEWLGKIPWDWSVSKLKYISTIKNGATPSTTIERYWNGDIDWFTPTDFKDKYLVQSSRTITKQGFNSCGTNLVSKGSILITCRAPIGNLGIIETEYAAFNQGCKSISSNDNENKYIYYFLDVANDFIKSKGNGSTFMEISSQELNNINIPQPKTKQKIVDFLGHKTAQFDFIISKKELLIEKLEEAKKSLISEIVTGKVKIVDGELVERKADEMKDSGVKWVGMIPKDWDVKRLKYLLKINPIKSEVRNNNIKCSFVPMNKIERGKIILDEDKLVSEVYDGYTYFRNRDIVMAKVTPCFENGNMAIADSLTNSIAFGTTEINVFRATNIDLNFIYYSFQESHFMNYAVKHMIGVAGLKRIPTTYFENYYIGIPDETEQKLISDYIKSLFKSINRIEHKTNLQIQKLKQAKQSLISEAVTGNIDLRDWEIQ